jgi:hypothetical protein
MPTAYQPESGVAPGWALSPWNAGIYDRAILRLAYGPGFFINPKWKNTILGYSIPSLAVPADEFPDDDKECDDQAPQGEDVPD